TPREARKGSRNARPRSGRRQRSAAFSGACSAVATPMTDRHRRGSAAAGALVPAGRSGRGRRGQRTAGHRAVAGLGPGHRVPRPERTVAPPLGAPVSSGPTFFRHSGLRPSAFGASCGRPPSVPPLGDIPMSVARPLTLADVAAPQSNALTNTLLVVA